jgi:hypothetical protein
MLHSVYIEKDDNNEAPPTRVLKVSYLPPGKDTHGEDIEPVVFFGIGSFNEGTFKDVFESPAEQQFSVTVEDLMRALIGLGVIDTTAYLNPNREHRHAA